MRVGVWSPLSVLFFVSRDAKTAAYTYERKSQNHTKEKSVAERVNDVYAYMYIYIYTHMGRHSMAQAVQATVASHKERKNKNRIEPTSKGNTLARRIKGCATPQLACIYDSPRTLFKSSG